MSTEQLTQSPDFTVRALASGNVPTLEATFRPIGSYAFAPGASCRVDGGKDCDGPRYAWAVALEREEKVLAAVWSAETGEEGRPPRLVVAGGLRIAGEQGVAALLAAGFRAAQSCGQHRLSICIPREQPSLLALLERAGFRVHSSFGFGGVAEVELDVALRSDTVLAAAPWR